MGLVRWTNPSQMNGRWLADRRCRCEGSRMFRKRDASARSERCTSVADHGPSHNVLRFSAPQSFLAAKFSIYPDERQLEGIRPAASIVKSPEESQQWHKKFRSRLHCEIFWRELQCLVGDQRFAGVCRLRQRRVAEERECASNRENDRRHRLFIAVHESGVGTKPTYRGLPCNVRFWG